MCRFFPKSILFFFTRFGLFAALFVTLGQTTPARAATLTVTDCSAPSGAAGQLVETIAAASPGDTVNFSCSGTITLSATLNIAKNLTLDGSGQTVTISGGNAVRVLLIDPGITVNLNQLTLSGGTVTGPGGGIVNQGDLTVSNSTISGNSATTTGGGIYSVGTLIITNSTVSGNSAANAGGIFNGGTLATVSNSTISSNSATSSGGGLYNNSSASLTVSNSTLSGNSAMTAGGGLYNNTSGTVTVSNSTLSSNTGPNGSGLYNSTGASALTITNSTFSANSGVNGGGIQNRATASITNSTFSGNTATNRGGAMMSLGGVLTIINSTLSGNGATNGGGGFYGSGTLNFSNTIIANSTSGSECFSTTIGTNLNNLVEDGSCSAALSGDPNLGTLADNGGPTQTFALLLGSPAIDAGDNVTCAAAPVSNLDQRGATRPTDGDASGVATCDIGAFELGGVQCGIQSAPEPADYPFLGNINLQVTGDGTDLNCLRVTDIPYNHPNATTPLETGKYWQIVALQADQNTEATPDFSVNLTLPFATADADDKLCRYTGSGWACAADGYVSNTSITRNNISQFSAWAVGNNSSPTAIRLSRLTASEMGRVPGLWVVLGGLLALGALRIGIRGRKRHEK